MIRIKMFKSVWIQFLDDRLRMWMLLKDVQCKNVKDDAYSAKTSKTIWMKKRGRDKSLFL